MLALAGCAGAATPAPDVVSAGRAANEEASPDDVAEVATCIVEEPSGPAPSILVASWPETPRPPTRDARGRRVIHLDGIDAYGPLRVLQIDSAGAATDLGEGSDPRFYDGAILYVEGPRAGDTPTTLVRLLPDGTIARSVGGTGLLSGLGGPVAPWQCPFTRDGRFMAFAGGCEDEGETCALMVYGRFPYGDGEDGRLDRIELTTRRRPNEVLLTEDASVAVTCTRTPDDEGTLFWMNRRTSARANVPIAGRCLALAPEGDRVLATSSGEELELVHPSTGERSGIESSIHVSAAAFDACGTSAVVVGRSSDTNTQRALRLFFDGRAPTVLVEVPASEPEFTRVEVDARGWVLVSSDEPGVPAHVVVVSIAGGPAAEWTVPGRVFGATLGP